MSLRATLAASLLACFAAASAGAAQQPKQPRPAPAGKPPARSPSDPNEQLLAQADAAMQRKDFAAAVAALEKYLAAKPDDAIAHFHLGYALSGLDQWDRAQAEYERALALDPKMAAAHLNLGLVLLDRQPAAAVPSFQRAAEMLPDQARPRYLLGLALEKSGDQEGAIARYREAAELDANNFDIRFALGRVLAAVGRGAEAEPHFRAALELKPDSAAARLGLATSLLLQKKFAAALPEQEAYVRAMPDDRGARVELASIYLELGRATDALRELDRVLAAGKVSVELYRFRAAAQMSLKDLDGAIDSFVRAVALAPGDAELRARLGRLWLEKRDFAAAQKTLLEALHLNPDLVEALGDLSTAYYLAENYPAALEALDRFERKRPPTAGTWFIRATCYDKLGQKAEALAAYEKFLVLDEGRSERQNFQARQRVRILKRELERKK